MTSSPIRSKSFTALTAAYLAESKEGSRFPPNGVLHVDLQETWDNLTDARLAQSMLEAVIGMWEGEERPVFVLITNDKDYVPLLEAIREKVPTITLLQVTLISRGEMHVSQW